MTSTNKVTLYKGTNQTFLLTVTSNGQPVDLAGCKIHFVAARTIRGTPTIIKRTANMTGGSDTQIKVLTPSTDGKAEVYFVPADTSGEKSDDNYVYEIKIKFADDTILPAIQPSTLVISDTILAEFDMQDIYSGEIDAVLTPSAISSVSS